MSSGPASAREHRLVEVGPTLEQPAHVGAPPGPGNTRPRRRPRPRPGSPPRPGLACVRCSTALRIPPAKPSATTTTSQFGPDPQTGQSANTVNPYATTTTKRGNTTDAVATLEGGPARVTTPAVRPRGARPPRYHGFDAHTRTGAQVELDAMTDRPPARRGPATPGPAAGRARRRTPPMLVAAGEVDGGQNANPAPKARIGLTPGSTRVLRLVQEGRHPGQERDAPGDDRHDDRPGRPQPPSVGFFDQAGAHEAPSADHRDQIDRPVLRVPEEPGHGPAHPPAAAESRRSRSPQTAQRREPSGEDQQHLEGVGARFSVAYRSRTATTPGSARRSRRRPYRRRGGRRTTSAQRRHGQAPGH